MKITKKMRLLLEKMERVERMERGKLCQMGRRPHYNHQTWQDGRNVVRYVPRDQAPFVQEAIDGYALFMKLAEKYVDEVVRQTRREQEKRYKKKKNNAKRARIKTKK
jgi:hypothetical protein